MACIETRLLLLLTTIVCWVYQINATADNHLRCPPGQELNQAGYECNKCLFGYFSENGQLCQHCPPGFYTNEEGSTQCLYCGNACRICNTGDYKEITGECVDGKQTVTRIRSDKCRSKYQGRRVTTYDLICYLAPTTKETGKSGFFKQHNELLIAIAITGSIIFLLLIFLAYCVVQNRYLQRQLLRVPVKELDDSALVNYEFQPANEADTIENKCHLIA